MIETSQMIYPRSYNALIELPPKARIHLLTRGIGDSAQVSQYILCQIMCAGQIATQLN
jgi:hypothetical protein